MSNQVHLVGRLVHFEEKQTNKGTASLQLRIVETTVHGQTNDRMHGLNSVRIFGRQVERLKNDLKIGDPIEVISTLKRPDEREGDCKRVRYLKDLGFATVTVLDSSRAAVTTLPTKEECSDTVQKVTKGEGFAGSPAPPPPQAANDSTPGWARDAEDTW